MRKSRTRSLAARRYGDCVHCGGRVRERLTALDYRWGLELLAVVEDVPAGVCEICGQEYVRVDVARRVEATAHSSRRAASLLAIPLRSLDSR